MSWKYRVIKEGDEYGICEYYVNEFTDGASWTGMVTPVAMTKEELRWVLEKMLEAIDDDTVVDVE